MIRIMLFISIIMSGCSTPAAFQRSSELFKYMNNIQGVSTKEKQHIIILINNFCGACNDETNRKLKRYFAESTIPTNIVVADSNEYYYRIFKNLPGVNILFDRNKQLKKHGLSLYVDSHYFLVENNEIVMWSPITNKEVRRIMRGK